MTYLNEPKGRLLSPLGGSAPRQTGQWARADGKPITANPCSMSITRRAWAQGWQTEEDARRADAAARGVI